MSFFHDGKKYETVNEFLVKDALARRQTAVKPEIKVTSPARKPAMNKTEAEYVRMLEAVHGKENVFFNSIKLKVGEDTCWYTPDVFVRSGGGTGAGEFHEVKGAHVWDDARVKFKAAKLLYPMFKWVWAQKTKEGWQTT